MFNYLPLATMRLLHHPTDGVFSLTPDFPFRRRPLYAILSHTWSANENDEVSLQDLQDGKAQQKLGFRKLAFCIAQARKDGLEYSWIDTCCINRLSEPELSHAIRSMYRWYGSAEKCYVYMSDVSGTTADRLTPRIDPHQAFFDSLWFKRGWTVQELLAPADVTFFAYDGSRIGDKKEWSKVIALRTGIPEKALLEQDLSSFSLEDRLSWLKSRETKREEDMIYAALGLLGIHLNIYYGEGLDHARARLMRKIEKTKKGRSSPSTWLQILCRVLITAFRFGWRGKNHSWAHQCYA